MPIKYHDNVEQGTQEWLDLRCGVLTASEAKYIITPTYKVANNEKTKMHAYELAAQRITKHTEEFYVGVEMIRGHEDEVIAREIYDENYSESKGEVTEVGFVTSDDLGFTIGYSPDWLVGDEGLSECKSRRQKFQMMSISTWDTPKEHDVQMQFGLFVTKRKWLDYVQYSNGMPMVTIRVYPDPAKQAAIQEAVMLFEGKVQEIISNYKNNLKLNKNNLIDTERREVNQYGLEITEDD